MRDSYKRLCGGLPAATGGAGFATEPRKVKAWVAALPRANAMATEQELARALASLASQKLEGGARLGALEELRGAAIESIALLERQFNTSPLPLPPDN